MHIILFVIGFLLFSVALCIWRVSKADRTLAAQEVEAFRRDADRAHARGDSHEQKLSNLYQVDAMAEACGDDGLFPSWMYILAFTISFLLMAPAVISWLL